MIVVRYCHRMAAGTRPVQRALVVEVQALELLSGARGAHVDLEGVRWCNPEVVGWRRKHSRGDGGEPQREDEDGELGGGGGARRAAQHRIRKKTGATS